LLCFMVMLIISEIEYLLPEQRKIPILRAS